jgi:hypothetical protein
MRFEVETDETRRVAEQVRKHTEAAIEEIRAQAAGKSADQIGWELEQAVRRRGVTLDDTSITKLADRIREVASGGAY